jgi:hypothetical protein
VRIDGTFDQIVIEQPLPAERSGGWLTAAVSRLEVSIRNVFDSSPAAASRSGERRSPSVRARRDTRRRHLVGAERSHAGRFVVGVLMRGLDVQPRRQSAQGVANAVTAHSGFLLRRENREAFTLTMVTAMHRLRVGRRAFSSHNLIHPDSFDPRGCARRLPCE